MKRRSRIVVLAVAAFLVATVTPARACSCAPGDARDGLKRADAAIVGTLVSKTPVNDQVSTYSFSVDEAIKGTFDQTVDVESASNGAACGLEVGVGGQTGLFLRGSHAEGWEASLCDQISPEDLREAAAPMPAPDGDGPIKMIVAGSWGDQALIALDAQGRTLMYGTRVQGADIADLCPWSRRFLEVPWRGEQRWVVRRTSTFETLDVVYAPRGTSPETCLAADASRVLASAVLYDEPFSNSRLYRYADGRFVQLYEGSSTSFEKAGGRVYLTEGRYGSVIRFMNLRTRAKTLVARVPSHPRGVTVSPDRSKIALTAGFEPESLVVIDLSTSPATVRRKDHSGNSGTLQWLSDRRLVYFPGGSKVKIFDARLNLAKTLDGDWYTSDADVVGGVAYGIGWGTLFRAPLPDGPASTLRAFPSPEIRSLEVLRDEVHPQAP